MSFTLCTLVVSALALSGPNDQVDELIRRGRVLLDVDKSADALVLFTQANELAQGSLKTRTWMIRAQMDAGAIDEALIEIDALADKYPGELASDYLLGMALHRRAKTGVDSGNTDQSTTFAFQDATAYLKDVTERDEEAYYYDAYLPLAEAAWYSQQLEIARPAAERAVALQPKSADAAFLQGQILFSCFTEANADPSRKAAADAFLDATVAAFMRVPEILSPPTNCKARQPVFDAYLQTGYAHVWRGAKDDIEASFAQALSWNPQGVDFSQLYGWLTTTNSTLAFTRALETGLERYEARADSTPEATATLLWWLGYGHFSGKRYTAAEEAYTRAFENQPSYVDSHFYIALSRYYRQEYASSIDALRKHWDLSPENLVQSVQSNFNFNISVLDYMVGWCSREARPEDAAFLCEVRVAVAPDNWEFWDNLGLFSRDTGETLMDTKGRERAQRYFKRALAAYERASELAPDKPHLVNDTAVILHYYLKRDFARAREMYAAAYELAAERLADPELEASERDLATTALRDSKDNLRRLDEYLERRRRVESPLPIR